MNIVTKTISIATFALAASMAQAAPVDVTGSQTASSFSSFGTKGVHGLELRGARKNIKQDWQIGLGAETHTPAKMDKAHIDWDRQSGLYNFAYDYLGGTNEFRIWDADAKRPSDATVSWNNLSLGNAINIYTKGKSVLNITELDGHAFSFSSGGMTKGGWMSSILYGEGFKDGFTILGSLDVRQGGGSANAIGIKAGNVTPPAPIPVPAALPLLASAFGLMGWMRCRRQTACA